MYQLYRLYAVACALILGAIIVETKFYHNLINDKYFVFLAIPFIATLFILFALAIRKNKKNIFNKPLRVLLPAVVFIIIALIRFSPYSVPNKLSVWSKANIIPAGYNKPSTNTTTNVVLLVEVISVDGKKTKNYRYQFKLKEIYLLNEFIEKSTNLNSSSKSAKRNNKPKRITLQKLITSIVSENFLLDFSSLSSSTVSPSLSELTGIKFYAYSRGELITSSGNTLLILPYYITPTTTITNRSDRTNQPSDGYQEYLVRNNYFANLYFAPEDTVKILVNDSTRSNHASTTSSVYSTTLATIHNHLQSLLDRYVAYPISAFAFAMTTGIKDDIPDALNNVFISTGTYHILAVSGMNAGIIIFFFYELLKFLRLRRVTNLTIIFLSILPFYVYLTDFQVTMVRAYLMGLIALFLFMFDRRINLLTILAISFIVFILYDPTLIYSVSFQLSYAAIFGIAQFVKVSQLFHIQSKVALAVIISLGAQLGTFPVAVYYFGYNNFLSVFYNVGISLAVTVFFISVIAFLFVGAILSLPYLGLLLNLWGKTVGWIITIIGEAIISFLNYTSFEFSWYYVEGLRGELFYALIFMIIFSIITEGIYLFLKKHMQKNKTLFGGRRN